MINLFWSLYAFIFSSYASPESWRSGNKFDEVVLAGSAPIYPSSKKDHDHHVTFAKTSNSRELLQSVYNSVGVYYAYYSSSYITWHDAESYCNGRGMHLASIHNDEENGQAASAYGGTTTNERAWIGLNDEDVEDSWVWTDGTSFDYSSWGGGQPDDEDGSEDCVHLWLFDQWNDNNCDTAGKVQYFICQNFCSESGYDTNYGLYGILCNEAVLWSEAESYCNDVYSTSLASIHSDDENDVALGLVNDNNAWIGFNVIGNDSNSYKWVWTDDSPNDYTNWYSSNSGNYNTTNEPNNFVNNNTDYCTRLSPIANGTWNNNNCDTQNYSYFLCNEYNPTNSPTNIPTHIPSNNPTKHPTIIPTEIPTATTDIPTKNPTNNPTTLPSLFPSIQPSLNPTHIPTKQPTRNPSAIPTRQPTETPTEFPTSVPSAPTNNPTVYPTDTSFTQVTDSISSWRKSNTTLAIASSDPSVAYDKSVNPDCIWVFSMHDCQNCFYCYNITSDEISIYTTSLTMGGYNYNNGSTAGSKKNSLIINGILYWTTNDYLFKYDFDTDTQTILLSNLTSPSALSRHPNNDKVLFILDGDTPYKFSIYYIDNDTLIDGPRPKYEHYSATSIVNNFTGIPYLYVFGGRDAIYFERLNLNNVNENEWEILNFTLNSLTNSSVDYSNTYHMAIETFENYIFLVGGRDSSENDSSIDDTAIFDVLTQEISLFGHYPFKVRRSDMILVNNKIYSFGGIDDTDTMRNDIYFTDTIKYSSTTPTPSSSVNNNTTTTSSSSTLEFITIDDISFVSFETLSSVGNKNNQFNPGFRNQFKSIVEIELNTPEKINLFTNEHVQEMVNIDVLWNVYLVNDVNDGNNNNNRKTETNSSILNFQSNNSDIVTYNEQVIDDNILRITNYFIIDANSVLNQFSVSSICNSFSNNYFESGNEYQFENIVNISLNTDNNNNNNNNVSSINSIISSDTYSVEISEYAIMTATYQPNNGDCTINPTSGVALLDTFNLSCFSWSSTENTTNNSNNNSLEYAFIFDSTFFIKEYNSLSSVSTILTTPTTAVLNITAVIFDSDTNTGVCKTVTAHVSNDINDILNNTHTSTPVTNITDILIEIVIDLNVSDLSVLAVYNAYAQYIMNNNSSESIEDIFEFQNDLIELYINSINFDDNISDEEALSILYILAHITNLLIDSYANLNGVYFPADLIVDIIEITQIMTNVLTDGDEPISTDTGDTIVTILSNVVVLRRFSDESSDISKQTGQRTLNIAVTVSESLLLQLVPGETIFIETELILLESTKISVYEYNECGKQSHNAVISLSDQLLLQRSNNGSNFMDCSLLVTNANLYAISQISIENLAALNLTFNGNFLNIDISSNDNNSNSNKSYEYLDECQPIIFRINMSLPIDYDIDDDPDYYPRCSYFNESTQTYQNDGCFVFHSNFELGYTYCACNHTTFFSTQASEFAPEINYKSKYVYVDITIENLLRFNLGWVVCLSWIATATVLCSVLQFSHKTECANCNNKYGICQYCWFCTCHLVDDTPLIIQQQALFVTKHDEEKAIRAKYRSIKEARLVRDDMLKNRPYWIKLWNLYRVTFRNDHIWFSICCRNNGSNFTHSERVAVVMIRLLTLLSISAIFFGVSKGSVIGDISLAFWESILGYIPIFLIQGCIKLRKPTAKEIAKYNEEFDKKMKRVEAKVRFEVGRVDSLSASPINSGDITPDLGSESGDGDLDMDMDKDLPHTISLSNDLRNDLARTDIINAKHRQSRAVALRKFKKEVKKKDNDGKIKRLENKQLLEILNNEDEIAAYGSNNGALRHGIMLTSGETGENDENDETGNYKDGGRSKSGVQSELTSMDAISGKLNVLNEIRHRLVDRHFKYPSSMKNVNICIIVTWTLLCAIVTTLWCLWFDAILNASNEYKNDIISECSGRYYNYDIAEKTFLNYNTTQEWLNSFNGTFVNVYEAPDGDSFGNDLTVSQRFMIATFTSYMLTIFFWSPLILLIKSILKLRHLMRHPDRLNEAMLFYDSKYLIDLDEIVKTHAQVVMTQLNSKNGDGQTSNDHQAEEILKLSSVELQAAITPSGNDISGSNGKSTEQMANDKDDMHEDLHNINDDNRDEPEGCATTSGSFGNHVE